MLHEYSSASNSVSVCEMSQRYPCQGNIFDCSMTQMTGITFDPTATPFPYGTAIMYSRSSVNIH
jgi:hypothetical protein